MCQWVKKGELYTTECGRTSKVRGRGWDFCPYCGAELDLNRKQYQANYYRQHEDKFKDYYKARRNHGKEDTN